MACNSPSKSQEETNSSKGSSSSFSKDKLVGKWLQPIPGMEAEKQGFELHKDGSASSLNIHTLLYDKWEKSGDTLLLWYHTEGVKVLSNSVDTLLIKKLDDTNLIVSQGRSNGENDETYTKDK
ncbi:lipocalin family protein [Chryseobacterium sp. ISL-6]|uniref:lipocalin family protein n=1 Tax=Chryseobacterium sp. ISL-6 TaxID=2819143 RepID=UPI001BE8C710|nr:lipocalin family protein [Chryseobacterium sp. ISL-6]MBT2620605.1 lipocalin family protein [Chryseobacterium sp. ISL-6]